MTANDDPESDRRSRSGSIISKSSRRQKNRKKKNKMAKQWTFFSESLKRSLDGLYEICRIQRNVNGCKEVLMFLRNGERDFHGLIEQIKVEANWSGDKSQPVAWEVRKNMFSSPVVQEQLLGSLPLSPLMFSDVVKKGIAAATKIEPEEPDVHASGVIDDNGEWKVVSKKKRRNSISDQSKPTMDEKETVCVSGTAGGDVYERLSRDIPAHRRGLNREQPPHPRPSSARSGCVAGRLTAPKSAMDLPQTKASMAKMAYSRQLIWKRNQPNLAEKFRERQKRDKSKKSASVLAITETTQQTRVVSSRARGQQSAPASEHNRSLQSIREAANEDDDRADVVPSDPRPTADENYRHGCMSEPVCIASILSSCPPELESDDEWQIMTEEEKSLALEEQSLNLEIEHEKSRSVDAELERQVMAEASELEDRDREEAAQSSLVKCLTYSEMAKKMEALATQSWAELMEEEFSGFCHEPGILAEKHEKLISPTRKRNLVDQDDLSRRSEAKQRRAEELRAKLMDEKAARLAELNQKISEVKRQRAEVTEKMRAHITKCMNERLDRAQENREKNITNIVKKAKDDDQRVMENQFYKSLSEGTYKSDMRNKETQMDLRLKKFADDKAKKLEERQSANTQREQAAEERRRQAEFQRSLELKEKLEQKEARWLQQTAKRDEEKREKRRQAELDRSRRDTPKKEPIHVLQRIDRKPDLRKLCNEFGSRLPSTKPFEESLFCSTCGTKVHSEMFVFIHVLSSFHLKRVGIESNDYYSAEQLIDAIDSMAISSATSSMSTSYIDDTADASQTAAQEMELLCKKFTERSPVVSPQKCEKWVSDMRTCLESIVAAKKSTKSALIERLENQLKSAGNEVKKCRNSIEIVDVACQLLVLAIREAETTRIISPLSTFLRSFASRPVTADHLLKSAEFMKFMDFVTNTAKSTSLHNIVQINALTVFVAVLEGAAKNCSEAVLCDVAQYLILSDIGQLVVPERQPSYVVMTQVLKMLHAFTVPEEQTTMLLLACLKPMCEYVVQLLENRISSECAFDREILPFLEQFLSFWSSTSIHDGLFFSSILSNAALSCYLVTIVNETLRICSAEQSKPPLKGEIVVSLPKPVLLAIKVLGYIAGCGPNYQSQVILGWPNCGLYHACKLHAGLFLHNDKHITFGTIIAATNRFPAAVQCVEQLVNMKNVAQYIKKHSTSNKSEQKTSNNCGIPDGSHEYSFFDSFL